MVTEGFVGSYMVAAIRRTGYKLPLNSACSPATIMTNQLYVNRTIVFVRQLNSRAKFLADNYGAYHNWLEASYKGTIREPTLRRAGFRSHLP